MGKAIFLSLYLSVKSGFLDVQSKKLLPYTAV
jgi:hypothetical protein